MRTLLIAISVLLSLPCCRSKNPQWTDQARNMVDVDVSPKDCK